MQLEELNHWWTEQVVKPELVPPFRRDLFTRLWADRNRRQVQVLVGLRRVGKSTLFYQLIDALLKEEIDPLHLFYCSFDEPEFQERRLSDILSEYSKTTGIDYKSERVWIFLDEVQKSRYWVSDVKLFYDHYPNLKIFISGSASLNILSEAKRSLAGRALYYELPPLSFSEFLRFRGFKVAKQRLELYRERLKKEFEQFCLKPFPELVNEKDRSFIKSYVRSSIIEPIIFRDVPKEFGSVDVLLLEKLITIFLSNPGQYIRIDELSKELRRAKTTLYRAVFYLEFSFLIRRLLNFRPSVRTFSRKLAKIYAYHPSLTVPYEIPEEKFVENLVMFEIGATHYWRERDKEVDFLHGSIPVEVKFKSKLRKEDIKHLNYFLTKYGEKLGIKKAHVITRDEEGRWGRIRLVPMWKLCLRGL